MHRSVTVVFLILDVILLHNCQASSPFLLYTQQDRSSWYNQGRIYKTPLDKNGLAGTKTSITKTSSIPKALAYDSVTQRIYFENSYYYYDKIYSTKIDGTMEQAVISNVGDVVSLEVDVKARNLYWADYHYNRVEVARLDGTFRKILLRVNRIRAMVLDLKAREIYWCSYNSWLTFNIEKASMDGANRKVILTNAHRDKPRGFVIDPDKRILYWTERAMEEIYYIHLSNPSKIDQITTTHYQPFKLGFIGGRIYWSDRGSYYYPHGEIGSVNVTSKSDIKIVISSLNWPSGIYGYDPNRPLYGNSQCGVNNGGCNHLCLQSPSQDKCVCTKGMTLGNDGKTCYHEKFLLVADDQRRKIFHKSLSDLTHPKRALPLGRTGYINTIDYDPLEGKIYWTNNKGDISRAYLNGSSIEKVLGSNLNFDPFGHCIDVIGRNLYWFDSTNKRIGVSKLNGQYPKMDLIKLSRSPVAMALDGKRGYIYWAHSLTTSLKIKRSQMNGTNQETVATWPTSYHYQNLLDVALAFDPDTKRLYFHDGDHVLYTGTEKMDGIVHTLNLPYWVVPKGLAVKDSYLYWGDWAKLAVYRVNKTSLKNVKKVVSGVDPMDLHVYYNNSDTPDDFHPCAQNNGWCTHLCLINPNGYSCVCPTTNGAGNCSTTPVVPTVIVPSTQATTTATTAAATKAVTTTKQPTTTIKPPPPATTKAPTTTTRKPPTTTTKAQTTTTRKPPTTTTKAPTTTTTKPPTTTTTKAPTTTTTKHPTTTKAPTTTTTKPIITTTKAPTTTTTKPIITTTKAPTTTTTKPIITTTKAPTTTTTKHPTTTKAPTTTTTKPIITTTKAPTTTTTTAKAPTTTTTTSKPTTTDITQKPTTKASTTEISTATTTATKLTTTKPPKTDATTTTTKPLTTTTTTTEAKTTTDGSTRTPKPTTPNPTTESPSPVTSSPSTTTSKPTGRPSITCPPDYYGQDCTVYIGENKLALTLNMNSKKLTEENFKDSLTRGLTEYCLSGSCAELLRPSKTKRDTQKSVKFSVMDIIVLSNPIFFNTETEQLRIEIAILNPLQNNKVVGKSNLCKLVFNSMESIEGFLKGPKIVKLNPECGSFDKSGGSAPASGKQEGSGGSTSSSVTITLSVLLVLLFILIIVYLAVRFVRKKALFGRRQRHRQVNEFSFQNIGYLQNESVYDSVDPSLPASTNTEKYSKKLKDNNLDKDKALSSSKSSAWLEKGDYLNDLTLVDLQLPNPSHENEETESHDYERLAVAPPHPSDDVHGTARPFDYARLNPQTMLNHDYEAIFPNANANSQTNDHLYNHLESTTLDNRRHNAYDNHELDVVVPREDSLDYNHLRRPGHNANNHYNNNLYDHLGTTLKKEKAYENHDLNNTAQTSEDSGSYDRLKRPTGKFYDNLDNTRDAAHFSKGGIPKRSRHHVYSNGEVNTGHRHVDATPSRSQHELNSRRDHLQESAKPKKTKKHAHKTNHHTIHSNDTDNTAATPRTARNDPKASRDHIDTKEIHDKHNEYDHLQTYNRQPTGNKEGDYDQLRRDDILIAPGARPTTTEPSNEQPVLHIEGAVDKEETII